MVSFTLRTRACSWLGASDGRTLCYSWAVTVSEVSGRPFDAVLCDLDNVIRFYDMAPLAGLERGAGLVEGTTARVAFAPEVDLPLLLGKISKEEWVGSIASALSGHVPQTHARQLGVRLPTPRSGPMTRPA